MKTAEEKLEYLKRLAHQTEQYQNKELVDCGTDDERYDYVWKSRYTSDALAAHRMLVLITAFEAHPNDLD